MDQIFDLKNTERIEFSTDKNTARNEFLTFKISGPVPNNFWSVLNGIGNKVNVVCYYAMKAKSYKTKFRDDTISCFDKFESRFFQEV